MGAILKIASRALLGKGQRRHGRTSTNLLSRWYISGFQWSFFLVVFPFQDRCLTKSFQVTNPGDSCFYSRLDLQGIVYRQSNETFFCGGHLRFLFSKQNLYSFEAGARRVHWQVYKGKFPYDNSNKTIIISIIISIIIIIIIIIITSIIASATQKFSALSSQRSFKFWFVAKSTDCTTPKKPFISPKGYQKFHMPRHSWIICRWPCATAWCNDVWPLKPQTVASRSDQISYP